MIEHLQAQRQALIDRDAQAAKVCRDLSERVSALHRPSPLEPDYDPRLMTQWADAINHWKSTRTAIERWDATLGKELAQ